MKTFGKRRALFTALVTGSVLGACQLATEFDRTKIDAGGTDTGIAEVTPQESSAPTPDGGKDAPSDTPVTPDSQPDVTPDSPADSPADTTEDVADAGEDAPEDADDSG